MRAGCENASPTRQIQSLLRSMTTTAASYRSLSPYHDTTHVMWQAKMQFGKRQKLEKLRQAARVKPTCASKVTELNVYPRM